MSRPDLIPRWLELQCDIDQMLYELDRFRSMIAARSALDVAIDQATGHEAELERYGKALIDDIAAKQSEYFALWEDSDDE